MTEVSRKVAQKIQVNNLIRSMKMTELEKYSKNPGMIIVKNLYLIFLRTLDLPEPSGRRD